MSRRLDDTSRSSRRQSDQGERKTDKGVFSYYDVYRSGRSEGRDLRGADCREPRSWYDAREEDLCRRSRSRSRERPVARLTRRPEGESSRRDDSKYNNSGRSKPTSGVAILRPAKRKSESIDDRGELSPVILRPNPRADDGQRRSFRRNPGGEGRAGRRPSSGVIEQDGRLSHEEQSHQHYIILKHVAAGTEEGEIRTRFRDLGEMPKNVDVFPGKGVAFVYFCDEKQCVDAVKKFQEAGSRIRQGDNAQVSAVLVPAAQHAPRARELAFQIEKFQRGSMLWAAVNEYNTEETRRRTRSHAMEGINSGMWQSYLGDSTEGGSSQVRSSAKPKEGDRLAYCRCMVYDDVAEHYYDDKKNWAYNPRTGFWYHRDGIYYTYYEPLNVLVGYADDGPIRSLPGQPELTDEQRSRAKEQIDRLSRKQSKGNSRSSHVHNEAREGPTAAEGETDGRQSDRKDAGSGREVSKEEPKATANKGRKSERTTEAERSKLGSTKLASIHFNPNQFGTTSIPRSSQEHKSRRDVDAIAMETAPAPLMSEPVILAKPTRKVPTSKTTGLESPSGEAVCLLCQRRFNSYELLLRHEKLSKLHKSNLEKKNSAEDTPPWRKS